MIDAGPGYFVKVSASANMPITWKYVTLSTGLTRPSRFNDHCHPPHVTPADTQLLPFMKEEQGKQCAG